MFIDDNKYTAELKRGQKALDVAQMLLRRARGCSTEFNRERLPYPKLGMI